MKLSRKNVIIAGTLTAIVATGTFLHAANSLRLRSLLIYDQIGIPYIALTDCIKYT